MPTARELLEQADALMRRNRGGETSIPLLTDSVPEPLHEPSRRGPSTRERNGAMLRAPAGPSRSAHPETEWTSANAADVSKAPDDLAAASADAGPPVLTDAVEELAIDLAPLPERADDDPSPWLGPDTIDPALHSITGPAPDTVAVVPPVTLRAAAPAPGPAEEPDPTATRTFRAAGSATMPPPAGSTPPQLASELPTELPTGLPPEALTAPSASDDARWNALAEQISMQVLQRLDLFVDTGLKAQLAAHLQPIVVRASAELVETINDHVGKLVRAYVAEAIEREIAQWRQQQR